MAFEPTRKISGQMTFRIRWGSSPYSPKLIGYLFQRIAASRSDEPLRGGPRSKIANQVIEIPLRRHFEFRRIDLVKWEREIGEVLNELRVPAARKARLPHSSIGLQPHRSPVRSATSCKPTQRGRH